MTASQWLGILIAGLIANSHSAPISLFMVPMVSSLNEAADGGGGGPGSGAAAAGSVGRAAISLAIGVSEFVNGSASIFWGGVEGQYGILPTLSLGAVLMVLSLWLTSFAVPIYAQHGFLVLYLSIPLTGFASASVSPGILLGAVGKLFQDEGLRAKAMGYTFALSSVGGVATPPLIALLIATVQPWYNAWRILASVPLIMIPLAFALR